MAMGGDVSLAGDVSLYLHLCRPRAPRRADGGGSLGSVSYWQIRFSHVSDAFIVITFCSLLSQSLFCSLYFAFYKKLLPRSLYSSCMCIQLGPIIN